MSHINDTRWYEERWLEDRKNWQAKEKELNDLLLQKDELIRKLYEHTTTMQSQAEQQAQRRVSELEQALAEEDAAHKKCSEDLEQAQKRLEAYARPPLGEEFFSFLAANIELWDQRLVEEARTHWSNNFEERFPKLQAERNEAIVRHLAGEHPDWKRLFTGLVLEWALLAWLEGNSNG